MSRLELISALKFYYKYGGIKKEIEYARKKTHELQCIFEEIVEKQSYNVDVDESKVINMASFRS